MTVFHCVFIHCVCTACAKSESNTCQDKHNTIIKHKKLETNERIEVEICFCLFFVLKINSNNNSTNLLINQKENYSLCVLPTMPF